MKIKIRIEKRNLITCQINLFLGEFPIGFLKYMLFMNVILFILILKFLKYH